MTEEQLDRIISEARASWRRPPPLDLDAGWEAVQRRRMGTGAASWWTRGFGITGIAAGLALSFALGRASSRSAPGEATPVASAAESSANRIERPIEETATLLLGESVALLSALPASGRTPAADRRFAAQAGDLLVTTRLLLDSRASTNPKLHELLQDLEYVLAQIARMRGASSREEVELITDALQQQEIVPRIRSIAAGLNAGDD